MLKGYEKRVYHLIKDAGIYGINTNLLRSWTHIVDIPKVVSSLNRKGYKIISHREKDGTATYTLGEQKPRLIRVDFDDVTNTAIPIYG